MFGGHNFISTIFISVGWYQIRRGHWRRHVACMMPALISSTLFLIGYLVYHAHVGELGEVRGAIAKEVLGAVVLVARPRAAVVGDVAMVGVALRTFAGVMKFSDVNVRNMSGEQSTGVATIRVLTG